MSKKSENVFICPHCRKPISKTLFNYKHAVKNIEKAVQKQRKAEKLPLDSPVTPMDAYSAFRSESYQQGMGWMILHNAVDESRKEIFRTVNILLRGAGIKDPVNYTPPQGYEQECHVINDLFYWCLDYVYRDRLHTKAPALEIRRNENTQNCDLFFRDEAFASVEYLLTKNAKPVCPNPACNMILWSRALEITEKPVEIVMIGDPNTGKTVWEVALAAFLEQRKRCGWDASYPISKNAELILPETIAWRLEQRKNRFLDGRLPDQTPRTMQDTPGFDSFYAGMTSEFGGANEQANGRNLQDDRKAEDLVLILRERSDSGKLRSCRFVRITDIAGENSKQHTYGFSDVKFLRKKDALFFFADICTETGLNAVKQFMVETENVAYPYFGVLFPKADLPVFETKVYKSLCKPFVDVFLRVLCFRLEIEQHSIRQLNAFAAKFALQYLHCSPEVLAGWLTEHCRQRLQNSFLFGKEEDDAQTLFDDLTADKKFRAAFEPKNAMQWVSDVCANDLYYADDPTKPIQRDSEVQRRLYADYFLRNLLNGEIDFEQAQRVSEDIGFFPVSSMGLNSGIDTDTLTFDIDSWMPVNLFDPLVWFLRQYIS